MFTIFSRKLKIKKTNSQVISWKFVFRTWNQLSDIQVTIKLIIDHIRGTSDQSLDPCQDSIPSSYYYYYVPQYPIGVHIVLVSFFFLLLLFRVLGPFSVGMLHWTNYLTDFHQICTKKFHLSFSSSLLLFGDGVTLGLVAMALGSIKNNIAIYTILENQNCFEKNHECRYHYGQYIYAKKFGFIEQKFCEKK